MDTRQLALDDREARRLSSARSCLGAAVGLDASAAGGRVHDHLARGVEVRADAAAGVLGASLGGGVLRGSDLGEACIDRVAP